MTDGASTVAQTRWPRVYLDTAELYDIADGKTDPILVDDLASAMRSRGAQLIVTVEHMQDVPRGDASALDALATAAERFPLRAVVLKGPDEVEPYDDGVMPDIEIHGAANIREVIHAPAATPILDRLANLQDSFHVAAERVRHEERQRVPKGARELELQSRITLVRGWLGNEVADIVKFHAERVPSEIDRPSERQQAAVIGALKPLREILNVIGPHLDGEGIDRTVVLMRVAVAVSDEGPRRAPGLFLATSLAAERSRDPKRTPRRSDSVDLSHATYLPYVDVATVDAQAYGVLRKVIGTVHGPRRVRLFPNGQLRGVLAAVEALPDPPLSFGSSGDEAG